MAEDTNIRKIVIGKDCYAKYCGKNCPFMVKAEWSPKQGAKYGWIDVTCCANGGKWIDDGQPICPNGVAWNVKLGMKVEFDPEYLWKKAEPIIIPEILIEGKGGEFRESLE